VERVVLGHGQRAEARVGRERAQGRGGDLERDALAVRVLGERRVEEVDEVDIEVHRDGVASRQRPERLRGGTLGFRAERVDVDDREATLLDRRPLELGAGLDAQKHDLVVLEQRLRGPDAGELALGSLDVEQVRDPHPVQGAVDNTRGNVEIGVEVEVDEPEPLHPVAQRRDRAELDRAIPAEHQHCAVRPGHTRGHLSRPLGHDGEVRGARVPRVGRPAERVHVAGIAHLDARGRQRVEQPRITHRPRPLLLPRRVRPRAGGSSHDRHPAHSLHHPARR
jgi:hypothetical protein